MRPVGYSQPYPVLGRCSLHPTPAYIPFSFPTGRGVLGSGPGLGGWNSVWGWSGGNLVGRLRGGNGVNPLNTLPVFLSPVLTSSSQPGYETEREMAGQGPSRPRWGQQTLLSSSTDIESESPSTSEVQSKGLGLIGPKCPHWTARGTEGHKGFGKTSWRSHRREGPGTGPWKAVCGADAGKMSGLG